MNWKIISLSKASANQAAEITALVEGTNRHDGTGYSVDLEDDFLKDEENNLFLLYQANRLISIISLFTPSRIEAEITALTHPDYRRRGCFTALRLAMEEELRHRLIPSQLYVCDRLFTPGQQICRNMGAEYEFSEYLMKLTEPVPPAVPMNDGMSLALSQRSDLPKLAKIMSEAFGDPLSEGEARAKEFFRSPNRTLYTIGLNGEIAGMIGVYKEGQVDYIHGFCLGDDYRGKGLGRAALIHTAALCRESDPHREIYLEVETKNETALSLYLKAGFRTISVFDYYRRANPEEKPQKNSFKNKVF
jgi:ribosomal protein S18 acetylase RimI-like enzyme